MSNRLTKGRALVGSLGVDTSGGVRFNSLGYVAERKVKALAFSGLATSEQGSGWSLPDNGIVHDTWVKITTASTASGVISVGLITTSSGDADGFIASLGTSTTGVFSVRHTYTAATSGDIVTGNKRGIYLSSHATGTTDLGSWGYYAEHDFATRESLEKQVAWTLNSTSGTAGTVYFEFTEL